MSKIAVFACLAFLAAGCATTGASLRASSLRLEDRSSEFARHVRYDGADTRQDSISRSAETLAADSRELNIAVERGATQEEVSLHFDRVANDYDRLHDSLADVGYAAQNRGVLEDFDRVTEAYRDLEASAGVRHARVDSAVAP